MLPSIYDFQISLPALLLYQLIQIPCGLGCQEGTVGEFLILLTALKFLISLLILLNFAKFLGLVSRTAIIILNHVDGSNDFGIFVCSLFSGQSLAGTKGLCDLDLKVVIDSEICILSCFKKPVCRFFLFVLPMEG